MKTQQANLQLIIARSIDEIISTSITGVNLDQKKVINILKHLSKLQTSNIKDYTCEEVIEEPFHGLRERYVIRYGESFIDLILTPQFKII